MLALIRFGAASAPPCIRAQSPPIRRIGVLLQLELPKGIADLAKRYRIPTVHQDRKTVAQGALARYGVNFVDGFSLTAAFVEKIPRGAKPGDLHVAQTERFVTAINQYTATAPGIRITQSAPVRVDEVVA